MAGRKPTPARMIDPKKHKKSKKEIEKRIQAEDKLKTKANLRAPSYLTETAKKEWRRIMKLYREMDAEILSDLDKNALSVYCEAYAMWREAHNVWAKHQKVVSVDKEAQRIIDSTKRTMKEQAQIMSKYQDQLCLTPVGRAKMGMQREEKKESKLERIIDMDKE